MAPTIMQHKRNVALLMLLVSALSSKMSCETEGTMKDMHLCRPAVAGHS
jgi:hypothetical protein